MEKINCLLLKRRINLKECEPLRHSSNCQECPHNSTLKPKQDRVITLSERESQRDRKSGSITEVRHTKTRSSVTKRRFYTPPSKIDKKLVPQKLLEEHPEINDVPWILRIDSSYWENSKFLRWQLMRLNKKYQQYFRKVFDLYSDITNDGIDSSHKEKYEKIISDLNEAFQYDHFPDSTSEDFDSWVKSKKGESDWFLEKQLSMNYKFREAYKRVLRVDKSILPYPEYFLFPYPPPIDYEVRFPLPFFLEKLPPYKEEGKIKKGAPLNWNRHLLAYELIQKGLDLKVVCHSMFGNKKGIRKSRIDSQKKQIKRMIKRIEIDISNSYPFSSI